MEPQQETASSYYNRTRKRSFLYSRVTILTSLIILVITLGVNISVLYSQNKSTAISHAATPQDIEKELPSLPVGCFYRHSNTKGGLIVLCPTPVPTSTVPVPINISLPKLPPQCSYETSANGSKIICTAPHALIPAVPVTLPAVCEATGQRNAVLCKNTQNQNISVPLPKLPDGCIYTKDVQQYFVTCQSG